MKVLILTPNYPRKNATMNGIFIHQQVKALQALGVECHVLLLHVWYPPFGLHKHHPYWRNGYKEKNNYFDEYEGVKIHSVPMFKRIPTTLFKEKFVDRAIRSVVKYIKGNDEISDADWIYAHFIIDMGYIASKVKEQLNIKVAAITRGDDVHAWPESNPALIEYIKYTFSHADLMLANNKGLANDALKFADKVYPEFGVVYNGVNYKDFGVKIDDSEVAAIKQKYSLPLDKKLLLCIARNQYLKGWKELLEAIAENRNELKDWLLVAVTSDDKGKYSIDIHQTVQDLSIEEMVRIMEFVPFDEVKKLYSATNAFILPSYNEGISNAVMEAMASGLWVIASDVGGHSEIIENGKSGFLIQPKSVEAVSASLKYLVEHYESEKNIVAEAAQGAMEQLGDYTQNAQKLVGYFNGQEIKSDKGK